MGTPGTSSSSSTITTAFGSDICTSMLWKRSAASSSSPAALVQHNFPFSRAAAASARCSEKRGWPCQCNYVNCVDGACAFTFLRHYCSPYCLDPCLSCHQGY